MNKLRSVNTKFWEDPWIEDLTPNQKLLFLYLLTNTKTNMLGVYEVSKSKISFETGLNKTEIGKAFEVFERIDKVYYINNYVVLCNFLKNQKLNSNMQTSALNEYKTLPLDLRNKLSCNDSKGFESLSKGFEMVLKVEVEDEIETEDENEGEKLPTPAIIYYRTIKHLKLTLEEFDTLESEGFTKSQIDSTLDDIENYKKNTNYTSLLMTARKWMKRDLDNPPKKRENTLDVAAENARKTMELINADPRYNKEL